jgi:hypothetical protein
MTLARRILSEKRPLLLPLGLAVLANLAMYVFVVRPLGVSATGAARRADAARMAREAAERDLASAGALVEGQRRAAEDIATFYNKVLPASLPEARQLTYATLPAMARRANVRYQASQTSIDESFRSDRLGHLKIQMALQGEWQDVRRFIYALEASSSFVIIDDVTLAQSDPDQPITLTLDLSTYYRLARANGS